MCRTINCVFVLGLILLGCALCPAQGLEPEKAAALDRVADQFIERLHQTLDVGALDAMFVSDFAARYREFPGEFLPFPTPRMAKTLLKATDDATLRRKLLADWNLAYLTSVLLKAGGANADPARALPSDFMKLARKSSYLKPLISAAGQVTLAAPAELNEYLAEADQAVPMLRRSIRPEMFATAFRQASQQARPPALLPYAMGYDAMYMVPRESMMLAMVSDGGEFKIVTLAALASN